MSETLRDHAKRIVRELARADFARGNRTDESVHVRSGDELEAACTVLGEATDPVYRAELNRLERGRLIQRYPTSAVLLELWDRPWSPNALRFAAHRLGVVASHGIDVLEQAPADDTVVVDVPLNADATHVALRAH